MEKLIAHWVGNQVLVTLRIGGLAGAVVQQGSLTEVGDGGILLLQNKRQTFYPVTSILHITLVEKNKG
ncbi:MAG: hypothetical protein U0800_23765 [Isosphaeraceae bacterium]